MPKHEPEVLRARAQREQIERTVALWQALNLLRPTIGAAENALGLPYRIPPEDQGGFCRGGN